MKKNSLTSLAVLFAGSALTTAQTPPPAPLPPTPAPALVAPVPVAADTYVESRSAESGARIWGSAEYMMLWTKAAPISIPLLTTFAAGSPSATTGFGGALGVPGTTVLSPDRQDFGGLNGLRVDLGIWTATVPQLGFEVKAFFSEHAEANSSIASNANGDTPLRIPFFNVTPPAAALAPFPSGESSFVLADPNFANGGQSIVSTQRLWGAEANALWRVTDGGATQVSLIGGFRYLDLDESLSIHSRESLFLSGIPPFSFVATDFFGTRNQFYGGQLGGKVETQFGRFFVAMRGDLALGVDHESASVNGSSSLTTAGTTSITPGGVLAQATNIGRLTHDVFAVVPEGQIRLGMDLTCAIRVFVAYDFLYESDVLRPGNQIDRVLNLTSNPTLNGPGSVLTGTARPMPMANHSDFWAQSVSLGVEFRY